MKDLELISKAREVIALIEPLGPYEQQAVLELAETLRGYRRVNLALAENQHHGQTPVSQSFAEARQRLP